MLNKGFDIEYRENKTGLLSSEFERDGWVNIKTIIDDVILRGMAKITFNYLAKTSGVDFVLKKDFDSFRMFIRYGSRPNLDFFRIRNQSILYYDTMNYRQTNGHLVTVNWAPNGLDIVSQVSLFNHRTFHFRLAKNYSGLMDKRKKWASF